jgi:1-acyl-sn-glycerol-3-phosphate acyltransferase
MPRATALVERLANLIAHVFYRVDAVGAPPRDGALLLLPNHPNALLDPALVIATAGRPVRFIAKSTLFNGPMAPVLRASRAIPVFRKQDAGADVKRNAETFAAVDSALAQGDAVCIFPEGVSHSTGRLEPLRTGAARMALSAAARGVRVQLVPVGINPEEKTSFRSRLTVVYGRPFEIAAGAGAPEVTAEIGERMRHLIVEADPDADAELVIRVDRLYASARESDRDAAASIERRRTIAAGLQRLRHENPEWYETAVLQLRRYDDRLRRFGLRDSALDWEPSSRAAVRFVVRELPIALALVPLALAAILGFAVPYALTAGVGGLQKETDVTATAKVVSGAVFYCAWMVLLAVLAGWWFGVGWGVLALILTPALAVAGLVAIERESAALRTARSWLALRGAHPRTRQHLRRRRGELADVLDEVNSWLESGTRV